MKLTGQFIYNIWQKNLDVLGILGLFLTKNNSQQRNYCIFICKLQVQIKRQFLDPQVKINNDLVGMDGDTLGMFDLRDFHR